MKLSTASNREPRPSSMLVLSPILALLAVGLIALPASAQNEAPVVAVTPVIKREISTGQTFVGTAHPSRTAVVGSAVHGRVIELAANEGDRVEKGQKLAQLMTETIALELESAKAEFQLREQELAELENGSRPQEIAQAKARMKAAEALMEYHQAKRERAEQIYRRSKALSVEELELAVSGSIEAAEMLDEAKAVLDLVIEGPRKEVLAQARARVAMQRALVEKLSDQMKKHTIISRFDGFVTVEHTELGAWVSQGDPVAEVVALDIVEVESHVLEDHVPHLRIGDEVRVEISALPSEVFVGEVASIIPKADGRTRTFPVKVRVENRMVDNHPLIKAGMMSRVTLPTGPTRPAILVPKDALVIKGRNAVVWTVDPSDVQSVDGPNGLSWHEGPVQPIPVTLGVADGNRIAVDGALKAGQLVVIKGNERIQPPSPGKPSIVRWTSTTNSSAVSSL
ncbi:putative efflux pump membrane fusion protein [Planctomycetes bacterium Pan216]|uniref:Putative efflux pump membrane fusion protein n=1 Tax=Kolteria novifilia TaxID=2527975 RepID=A0A518B435_9BACT|nr:putative efflux pump membrane fusion protein [Planctomycetes bacterium Pan216]